jgi:hypothetical protein
MNIQQLEEFNENENVFEFANTKSRTMIYNICTHLVES